MIGVARPRAFPSYTYVAEVALGSNADDLDRVGKE